MRRHVKKMEKRMEREDRQALRRLEGRPKRHIFRKMALALAVLTLGGLTAGWFLFDVPSWQRLDLSRITSVQQTGAVYDRHDQQISALKGSQDRTVIPLSTLPDYVKNAFLAAEDGTPISMAHLLRAAVNEMKKNEIIVVREQLREYIDLLEDREESL